MRYSLDLEGIRSWALSKPRVSEEMPFGPDTLVFKVAQKVFLLINLDTQPLHLTFKGPPAQNELMRGQHPSLRPGYHSNKKHWNSLSLDGSVPGPEVWQWLEDSYGLVVAKLPRYLQKEIAKEALS
jgi:predicted DNA-binding protein (MmcQ/YjbR family)